MQFGVMPSSSGPLERKLREQQREARRKERLEAKQRLLERPERTGASIMREVAARNGMTVNDLRSPSHMNKVVIVRDEAIYETARDVPRLSLANIARLYYRDHTTIRTAIIRHVRRHGLPPCRGLG